MLSLIAAAPPSLTVGSALSSLERLSFNAVREQEGLLRRLRQQVSGGDALANLSPSDYALPFGSAIAVTGANEGIGKEAALFLAKAGYAPIVCARSDDKATATVDWIKQQVPEAQVASVTLDLADFASVERGIVSIGAAADELDAPLRGLLLNAGVWPTDKLLTADGLQYGLQVCHVSHWMLADALLPRLCEGGDEARVVTVSSSAHAIPDAIDLDDTAWERREWSATTAYGESKLANLLFAQELAQRQPQGLTSLALHPGVVATALFREFTPQGGLPLPLPPSAQLDAALASAADTLLDAPPVQLAFKKPAAGCRTSVYALLAPNLPSGSYLSDCELTDVSPAAKDPAARGALWRWTEAWVEQKRAAAAPAEAAEAAVAVKAEPEPVVQAEAEPEPTEPEPEPEVAQAAETAEGPPMGDVEATVEKLDL